MSQSRRSKVRAFFLHNWPQKLGSLLAAALVWWFATVGDTPLTQASRVVPIEVQGLGPDSIASGVPETAVLTIRGPSVLIDRLQSQSLGAIIDLAGRSGEFEEQVNVMIPQGVELVNVTPSGVIGTVESLQESLVPVEAIVIGSHSSDVRIEVSVEPQNITVSGVDSVLARVNRVLVPVRASAGERSQAGFAADIGGLPVSGVSLQPAEIRITVSEVPVQQRTEVSLELVPPLVSGFNVTARLEAASHAVSGPPSLLSGLGTVQAEVEAALLPDAAGTFTVPLLLALPDGVEPLGQPRAVLRLTPLVLEE